MFGRATVTLGIGPHASYSCFFIIYLCMCLINLIGVITALHCCAVSYLDKLHEGETQPMTVIKIS